MSGIFQGFGWVLAEMLAHVHHLHTKTELKDLNIIEEFV